MYTFLEIQQIFRSVNSWEELRKVSIAFVAIIEDGDLSRNKKFYIAEQSAACLLKIENL